MERGEGRDEEKMCMRGLGEGRVERGGNEGEERKE